MAKKKREDVEEAAESTVEAPGWYKGYDMKWLKKVTDHPDHNLVAEYEEKNGEIK